MHNSKPQLSKNGFRTIYKTIIDKKEFAVILNFITAIMR
jgi:hypothetical protein